MLLSTRSILLNLNDIFRCWATQKRKSWKQDRAVILVVLYQYLVCTHDIEESFFLRKYRLLSL